MEIRPYTAADDPHLMAIEQRSARGFPQPFVHFRRRFIDRAELYSNHCTLVAEDRGQIIGVTSIIVKDTLIGNSRTKIAYSFDTRVAPEYRRQGVGHALVEEKLKWARDKGAVGVYSLIVTTNQASMGMVQKSGYQKIRIILYAQFQPYPLIIPPQYEPHCRKNPKTDEPLLHTFDGRDLYVPHVAQRVQHLDFQRWTLDDDSGNHAGLSVYNQSKIYLKIPAEAPWPQTESDVERLGRNLQIFDVIGLEHPALLKDLFDWVRDDAVTNNVNKLTWLIDRNETLPAFIFDDMSYQTDYWLMYKPFEDTDQPTWEGLVYLDPRDI
ncbi:MAG: N-acetyltransferase family protein [Anaerolineales bacterium]